MKSEKLRELMIQFWDQSDSEQAKYQRIVTDKKITAIKDPAELERIWENSVAESLKQVLTGISLEPHWHVLDIGAGIGRLVRPISAKVKVALGVDVSPAMAKYSAEYLKERANALIMQNDGKSLSLLKSESFHFCYSMICFQHIPDVNIVSNYLAEIYRTLKPAGLFRIQVIKEKSLKSRIILALKTRSLSKLHATAFRKWSSDKKVGFEGNRYTKHSLNRLLVSNRLMPIAWHDGLGESNWLWATARKH